jgi:uncharacterized protein (TIGR03435 family)
MRNGVTFCLAPEYIPKEASHMKILGITVLAVATLLHGQPVTATFEVATVKASRPNDGQYVRGCKGGPGTDDPGFWRCTNATISMLVMRGYDIRRYQFASPDWTFNTNYEISARLPPGATKDQFREMIQNLLVDRFKLQLHRVKKAMAMYDLVVGKGGSKLKESVDQPAAVKGNSPGAGTNDAEGYPNIPKDCSGCMYINAAGKARYSASKETVKNLIGMLRVNLACQSTIKPDSPANTTSRLHGAAAAASAHVQM